MNGRVGFERMKKAIRKVSLVVPFLSFKTFSQRNIEPNSGKDNWEILKFKFTDFGEK